MCTVSVVIDSARYQLPPVQTWPYQQAADFAKVIDLLTKIDQKLGAKDCADDRKDVFLADLQKRIDRLESRRSK